MIIVYVKNDTAPAEKRAVYAECDDGGGVRVFVFGAQIDGHTGGRVLDTVGKTSEHENDGTDGPTYACR